MAGRRYLVIANGTVGGDELVDEVRRRAEETSTAVHVIVPTGLEADRRGGQDRTVVGGGTTSGAASFGDPSVRDNEESSGTTGTTPGGLTAAGGGEMSAANRARIILEHVVDRLGRVASDVTGDAVNGDVIDAATSVLRGGDYDEVILATPKAATSKLFGKDLPSRLEDAVDVPVATVHAEATDPDEAQ